jgi:hypothetical protein
MSRCVVLLTVMLLASDSAHAQLTLTESLIRREVMEFGGDWEGSDRVALLAFVGDRFTNEHFELLSHIRAVEWFHVSNVRASPESLRWLYGQPLLTKLDILESGQMVDGMNLIGTSVLGRLEEVRISDCKLSEENLRDIANMHKLKLLVLEAVEIKSEDVHYLSKCKLLKKLQLISINDIATTAIDELRESLPTCDIKVESRIVKTTE